MKPSPIGSKILSAYAILFAAIGPAVLACIALAHGINLSFASNLVLAALIAYFGIRVFAGDYSAVKLFAIVVILHYLGVTATNIWNFSDFPAGSRAREMAVPRMIRGILFAGIYAWYYLLRSKTADGFDLTST